MACHSRLFLALLLLGSGCQGDDPGVGSGSSPDDTDTDTDGASSGTDTGSSTVDPDSTSTTGDEAWAEICDGSEDLRLAMVLGGGGLVENELEREIGFYYLYVLGTCEYFALPAQGDGPWPDARRGVLDLATEEQLSRALDYGHLADIAGAWDTEGLSDGSTLAVSDGTHTVACYGGCEGGPEGARALWAEMGWIDALWAEGEALQGPVRVSVIGWADATIDEVPAAWPLSVEPWSLAIDGTTEPAPEAGDSILIDDPADATTLRELRRQYREDDLPEGTPNALTAYGHLSFTDDGGQDLFQLWMRDALPIEDERGLVPLPSP